MTTMIDRPAEARSLTRRDIEKFAGWLMDMPAELALSPADATPLAAKLIGHDIEPAQLLEVIVALGVRNEYRGSEQVLDGQQRRLDAAIDALLDVRQCEACREVIPDGSSRVTCNDVGFDFCGWGCHTSWHAGGRCDAGSDRS